MTLAPALRAVAAEVEDAHGVPVEVVCVGADGLSVLSLFHFSLTWKKSDGSDEYSIAALAILCWKMTLRQ